MCDNFTTFAIPKRIRTLMHSVTDFSLDFDSEFSLCCCLDLCKNQAYNPHNAGFDSFITGFSKFLHKNFAKYFE